MKKCVRCRLQIEEIVPRIVCQGGKRNYLFIFMSLVNDKILPAEMSISKSLNSKMRRFYFVANVKIIINFMLVYTYREVIVCTKVIKFHVNLL
jgi:hypothetical protein